MAETRTYQGYTYTRNAPGEPWARVGPASPRPVSVSPGNPIALPQAEADLERTRIQTAVDQRTLDLAERKQGIEEGETAEKRARLTLSQRASADNVLSTLRKARDTIRSGANVTGWSGALASLPGTEARALRGDLETIRANLSIDSLTNMRQNSPTGAAVGNSSDTDMRLLGATVAGLDNMESAAEVLDALDRIERHYARLVTNLNGFDPDSDAGRREMATAFGAGALELGDAGSKMPAPGNGSPLTGEQQRLLDAFYKANPEFTPEQLRAFTASVGIPEIANVDEIVAARNQGAGLAPAARAVFDMGDGQGDVSQGLSGINEGIASVLGLPVDAFTGAVNLVNSGQNWLNEALGGDPRANMARIENPIGGGQWMRENLFAPTIGPAAQTQDGQFWRRAGQSVGAASVPGIGAGRATALIPSLLSGTGGGLAAATAQQQFPDNVGAEIAAELAGSLVGGAPVIGAATALERNAVRSAVPSVDQLKAHASSLYDQAETRGIVAGANITTDLARDLTDIARREALVSAKGNVSEAYSKIGPVLKTIQDEAGEVMNPKRIQVLRETLADAAYTTEGREQKIARDMLRAFDDVTVPLAPELADARDVASRYLQSRPIDEAIELAGTRQGQFSQSGLDNALRTDFANLERKAIRGNETFRPEVLEAIGNVANPSGLRAAARWGGRFAPTTAIPIGMTGSPAAVGYMAGEPVAGALISGALAAGGMGSRRLANSLAMREAEDASLMARSGGTMQLPEAGDTVAANAVIASLLGQSVPYTTPSEQEDAVARLLAQTKFAGQ